MPSRQILWGGMRRDVHSLEDQLPLILGKVSGDQVEEGGLPRPVRADDGTDLSFFNRKAHPVHGHEAVEGFLQIFHGQNYRFHLAKIRRFLKKPRMPPGKKKRSRARIVPMIRGQYWVLEVTAIRR